MASEDPFTQAQSDILALLQQARPLLSSYIRIRSTASSASSPELREAREELESTLRDIKNDLEDLVDSVKAVEGDPYKYGLDVAEVARRRQLVKDVGSELEDMHRQLDQTITASNSNKGRTGLAHPDSFGNADEDDEDGYEAWEEQRQVQMMHQQDEALDDVFRTVGNLRAQADTMGRELEEQADLLEETENITDRVGGKLQTGMKKIRYVIEKNEELDIYDNPNTSKMYDDKSHPLLQQTPLSVNPFIDLPKAPTLPHNYASLPSTLPPSILHAAPTAANPDLPAYVTSTSGFASHPNSIIAQNNALLERMEEQRQDATKKVRDYEQSINDRELAEKRRKAPGWLDSNNRILEPEKPKAEMSGRASSNLMDDPAPRSQQNQDVDDLGAAMDRAFA